jgi:rare lipoprotein A
MRPMPCSHPAPSLLALAVLTTACCGEGRQAGGTTLREADARTPPAEGGVADATVAKPRGRTLRGEASYYADFFNGRQTANGERYDPKKLTAANRTLPLGTRVQITRLDTGQSVVVRVNDRGPFGKRRRIFDLSKAAARQLDMLHDGTAEIEAVVLED